MDPQMARQMQELQKENAGLKRLVAVQALEMQILKEARPNLSAPSSVLEVFAAGCSEIRLTAIGSRFSTSQIFVPGGT